MTIINLRYWLLAALVFTSGCASDATKYTQRQCIIALVGQVAPGQILATLFCEKEEPYTPEQAK